MSIKMAWLILGIERCDGTDQIDVVLNVYVKVSHAKRFGVMVENHTICTGVIENCQI
jgi:hypothetical protein